MKPRRTLLERELGVVPTDTGHEIGCVKRYGAVGEKGLTRSADCTCHRAARRSRMALLHCFRSRVLGMMPWKEGMLVATERGLY